MFLLFHYCLLSFSTENTLTSKFLFYFDFNFISYHLLQFVFFCFYFKILTREEICEYTNGIFEYIELFFSTMIAANWTSAYLNIGVWIYLEYLNRRTGCKNKSNSFELNNSNKTTGIANRSKVNNRKSSSNRLLMYSNLMDILKISILCLASWYNWYQLFQFLVSIFYVAQCMNFFFLLAFHLKFRLQFLSFTRKVNVFVLLSYASQITITII